MGSGFSNIDHAKQATAVSLDALRGQAMKRLDGVQKSMEGKGVGAAFIRAAKSDPVGDMGFMGGLILGMLIGVPLSTGAESGLSSLFSSASAGMEAVAVLSDQQADSYRRRQLSDYPEGRRRCALEAARLSKKFNLVSAKQRGHFSYNMQAELACMFEILDLLDQLEKEGVSALRLDTKEPVYDVLKIATQQLSKKGMVRSYAMPMLKAV